MSRRVLILCTSFYPRGTASSHRVAKIAKYLPEFGWTPVILCPDWNSKNDPWYQDPALIEKDPCEVIRAPYPADNRTKPRKAWLSLGSKFLPHLTPLRIHRNMTLHGQKLLKERHFDAIVASSPTMLSLRVASRLSKRFCVPFIPDLRDIADELSDRIGWSVRRRVRIETSLVRDAPVLVTTSSGLAKRLASRHCTPIHVVLNGFDPDDFAVTSASECSASFDIVYCGGLAPGRDPGLLFDALDLMMDRGEPGLDRLRICFYGAPARLLSQFAQGHRCRQMVHDMGRVPHAESIRIQQKATVLLLLSHLHGAGPMPSKVFEYLGAGRPILSVPGDLRISDAVLRETGAGQVGPTPADIARILRAWLDEWMRTGEVQYQGRPDFIGKYTRKNQTALLAEILNSVAGNGELLGAEQ